MMIVSSIGSAAGFVRVVDVVVLSVAAESNYYDYLDSWSISN